MNGIILGLGTLAMQLIYNKFLHIGIPNEKVIMNPRDDTKVGKLEDPVHDPHDFVCETLS